MIEEEFDIVSEFDPFTILRQEKRSIVHRTGLYHRSVNVLLRKDQSLLIQKRTSWKDVCPDMWDLSVAEHLQVGETYQSGGIFF